MSPYTEPGLLTTPNHSASATPTERPTFLDVTSESPSVSTSFLAPLDLKEIEDIGCDHSPSSLARPEATRRVISVGAIPCNKCKYH